MDIEHYTNFSELVNSINPRLLPIFFAGALFGGLVMTAVWRKLWWLLVIALLMPLLLYLASVFLPMNLNLTYRLFFMGVVTLATLGFAYYLAR